MQTTNLKRSKTGRLPICLDHQFATKYGETNDSAVTVIWTQ